MTENTDPIDPAYRHVFKLSPIGERWGVFKTEDDPKESEPIKTFDTIRQAIDAVNKAIKSYEMEPKRGE